MPREIRELEDLPELPLRQEEGLLWFLFEADAWGATVGVGPNPDLGVVFVFKGENPDHPEVVSVIDQQGNFLDVTADDPSNAPVVLRHSQYKDQLRVRLEERGRRN